MKKFIIHVVGTDTGIGKTYTSVGLLKLLDQKGFSTLGVKLLASGCFRKNKNLYSPDAMVLRKSSSNKDFQHGKHNYHFELPIAPHLVAKKMHIKLTKEKILKSYKQIIHATNINFYIFEGIGGVLVPLNLKETYIDFLVATKAPVIVVVGMRLGCLNHALLTYRELVYQHVPILGWIANVIDKDMLSLKANIQTLKDWLDVPCLGVTQYKQKPENTINYRNLLRQIQCFNKKHLY